MRKISILVPVILLVLFACKPTIHKENVLYIGNKSIRVGIIPSLGGTVVMLSKDNGPNLLLSDTVYWNIPDSLLRPISSSSPYIPVNGHTVWVGPQAGWWLQQDLDTILKKQRAEWPPDPYLVQAKYELNERYDELLGMLSPASPYTGIQFEKQVIVEPQGKVSFQVLAKNTRNSLLGWDLWFNTRVHAYDRVYVPVKDTSKVHIVDGDDSLSSGFQYRLTDGFFTFLPEPIEAGKHTRWSKAYIYPDKPYIATFCGHYLFLIRFPRYPLTSLHPMQSLVEIFLSTSVHPEEELMELEHHAPYKSLKPGEIMDAWETWEVFDYPGTIDRDEQIGFLSKMGL